MTDKIRYRSAAVVVAVTLAANCSVVKADVPDWVVVDSPIGYGQYDTVSFDKDTDERFLTFTPEVSGFYHFYSDYDREEGVSLDPDLVVYNPDFSIARANLNPGDFDFCLYCDAGLTYYLSLRESTVTYDPDVAESEFDVYVDWGVGPECDGAVLEYAYPERSTVTVNGNGYTLRAAVTPLEDPDYYEYLWYYNGMRLEGEDSYELHANAIDGTYSCTVREMYGHEQFTLDYSLDYQGKFYELALADHSDDYFLVDAGSSFPLSSKAPMAYPFKGFPTLMTARSPACSL